MTHPAVASTSVPAEVESHPVAADKVETPLNLRLGTDLLTRLGLADLHEGQEVTLTARVAGIAGDAVEIEPVTATVADVDATPEVEEDKSFEVSRPTPGARSPKDMGVRLNLDEDEDYD